MNTSIIFLRIMPESIHVERVATGVHRRFRKSEETSPLGRREAVAHWLDRADRSAFGSLRLGVEHSIEGYFAADQVAGRKAYAELTPHPSLLKKPTYVRAGGEGC